MSYEKTVWNTGDVVTAEKLNKLEDGVQNAGGSVITETYDSATYTSTLNKTYNEISAMVEDGKFPIIICTGETSTLINFVQNYSSYTEDETTTYYVEDNDGREFTANSADGILTSINEPA